MGYATDLTDDEYALIKDRIPVLSTRGRPPRDPHEIVNAVFYLVKTGCQWRLLPKEFGPWQTVYGYFKRWSREGTWFLIHEELRRGLRERMGKDADPSAGIIDSQSVKTVLKGGTKASTVARK